MFASIKSHITLDSDKGVPPVSFIRDPSRQAEAALWRVSGLVLMWWCVCDADDVALFWKNDTSFNSDERQVNAQVEGIRYLKAS